MTWCRTACRLCYGPPGRSRLQDQPMRGAIGCGEIEVLLGSGTPASAILTFDGALVRATLYRIDPAAFDAVRAAGGLPPATGN